MIGYSWVQTSPEQVNHILDLFLTSMVREAEAAGYHLLPFPFREGEAHVDDYRELIDTGRVDGFVLSSVNYNDPRINFLLERGGFHLSLSVVPTLSWIFHTWMLTALTDFFRRWSI